MSPVSSIDHWLSDPTPDLDSFIYHYTDFRGALGIVQSGIFRLGTYNTMNDPREAKEWVAEQLEVPPDHQSLHQEVDRLLRRSARIGSFTADALPTEGATEGSLFHRGWGRAAVWDRYADKHRGACLVFDLAGLYQRVHVSLPLRDGNVTGGGRVGYIDAPVTIPLAGKYESLDELRSALDEMTTRRWVIPHLYLTKNKDWESEREYRVVVLLWDLPADELDATLEVPYGDLLKAVVVGEALGDDAMLLSAIAHHCENEPEVLRCSWSAGAPVLRAL